MPRAYVRARPKPRSAAEVNLVLAGAPGTPLPSRPIRVLLVAGKKDHGKGEHDYPAWQKAWAALFGRAAKVEVATGWEWPAREGLREADVLVFYEQGDWTAGRAAEIAAVLVGGVLVYVRCAVAG